MLTRAVSTGVVLCEEDDFGVKKRNFVWEKRSQDIAIHDLTHGVLIHHEDVSVRIVEKMLLRALQYCSTGTRHRGRVTHNRKNNCWPCSNC